MNELLQHTFYRLRRGYLDRKIFKHTHTQLTYIINLINKYDIELNVNQMKILFLRNVQIQILNRNPYNIASIVVHHQLV